MFRKWADSFFSLKVKQGHIFLNYIIYDIKPIVQVNFIGKFFKCFFLDQIHLRNSSFYEKLQCKSILIFVVVKINH